MYFSFTPSHPGSKHFEHYEVCGVLATELVLEMISKWAPHVTGADYKAVIPGEVWMAVGKEVPEHPQAYCDWVQANVPPERRQKVFTSPVDPEDGDYQQAFYVARGFIRRVHQSGLDCVERRRPVHGVDILDR